ncbi:hypothetical protein BDZ89DRAFT_946467 [Hymenopellis radicata]|nr:hypothetical protein BDZ89DRAFT_946467 [Hymenopellis radicata]
MSFTSSFDCLHPDFIVSSIPDKTVFQVSRKALVEHSDVFRDMFACCDSTGNKQDDMLELDEPANVIDGLLRLLHDPPSLPETSTPQVDDDSDEEDSVAFPEISKLPESFSTATVIPFPLLPLLYSLVDKYGLSSTIEHALDIHLLLHVPTEPLRVYGFATVLNKPGIASTASEHVLPLASYSREDVQVIPTITAYHNLVLLQDWRVKAFRNLLLKEELFPHDYGTCSHHRVDAKLHWEARKFLVMGRVQCNMDVAGEMRPVEAALKSCFTCNKACIAAIEMLEYKCKRVLKRVNQIL